MYSDDYYSEDDECDDGRQQLEEYEMHCREIQRKATALLTIPAAQVLAGSISGRLAHFVQKHASDAGRTTLQEMLQNTIAEDVIARALESRQSLLQQPFNRAGYLAIRQSFDAACSAFAALLAAEEGLLPVESGAK
jgi:hypothetical protein